MAKGQKHFKGGPTLQNTILSEAKKGQNRSTSEWKLETVETTRYMEDQVPKEK